MTIGRRCVRDPRISLAIVLTWIVALLALGLTSLHANAEERIDPRSGQLSLTVTDLVVADGPIKLELQRSLASGGLLGTRWRLNWESRLSRLADLAVIDDESGSILFNQAGSEYRSAAGERLTYENDGRAVRRKPNESTETFDSQGRLIERADRNGNKVALRYGPDGRLARI
ncbi:MAG TPA: RHS repeat domain-containing protein, partial [Candidatus Binatia bacterium]